MTTITDVLAFLVGGTTVCVNSMRFYLRIDLELDQFNSSYNGIYTGALGFVVVKLESGG